MSKLSKAIQCDKQIEERMDGKRYVIDRHQCRNKTKHKSGRCWMHREVRHNK